jgi:hypothetical protein
MPETVSRSLNIRLLTGLLVLVVITAAGCGPRVKVPTAKVSGVVTVDGKPVEGLEVYFVPEAKIRPGVGITDSQGRFEAKFLQHQMGVPLGPCVVTISLYRGAARDLNLIPPQYNVKAAENPELRLTVTEAGAVFTYDVKMDKPLP